MSENQIRLLEMIAGKQFVRHNEIPPNLHDALRIFRRSGLVCVQSTGYGDAALEHEEYCRSLNPAYWLSPSGKDALALHRESNLRVWPENDTKFEEEDVPAAFRENGRQDGAVLTAPYLRMQLISNSSLPTWRNTSVRRKP
jgi:hypothetical protein